MLGAVLVNVSLPFTSLARFDTSVCFATDWPCRARICSISTSTWPLARCGALSLISSQFSNIYVARVWLSAHTRRTAHNLATFPAPGGSSTPTVRDHVKRIQRELRDGALTPDMARESLVTLTALLGNCTDEYRDADLAYKPVLLGFLNGAGAANKARIEAECSPEYARLREAKDTTEQVKQMIVTCRGYLRSLDEEMRLSR